MNRPFHLTTSQQMALDRQRNIVVTASAGSGKTATLVERYVELLVSQDGVGVGQILALTFNQKAAGEMRERVGKRLLQALQAETNSRRRARLGAIREHLHTAQISTIHSFCASVLREHPIEAGLAPDFAMLEEVEAVLLGQEAIDQTLAAVADRPPGDPDREHLRQLLAEWDRRYLLRLLQTLLRKKHLAGPWCAYYQSKSPDAIYAAWEAALLERRKPAVESLLNDEKSLTALQQLAALHPQTNAQSDSAEKRLAPIRSHIATLLRKPPLPVACTSVAHLVEALTKADGTPYTGLLGNKTNWGQNLQPMRKRLYAVSRRLAGIYDAFVPVLTGADRQAAGLLHALAHLFALVETGYQQKKHLAGKLDFDDLQERTLTLFDHHPQVARRLAARFRYIMVDEFQDTDPLQWAIIRHLVATEETETVAADKLFIVGDPKQSIYGFRDADVTVFRQVQRIIVSANRHHSRDQVPFRDDQGNLLPASKPEQSGLVVMGENFRTLPLPVTLVNAACRELLVEAAGAAFEVGYNELICTRSTAHQGSVELLLTPKTQGRDDRDGVAAEAEFIARWIRHMNDTGCLLVMDRPQDEEIPRPARFGDVAILLRRRTNLTLYENALRTYHIPFQVMGGLGFYQRQEIYDLYNILCFLANRHDSVALAGILRSPYGGLSDQGLLQVAQVPGATLWERLIQTTDHDLLAGTDSTAALAVRTRLNHWFALKDRLPLTELLRTILEESGAWGFLSFGERAEQTLTNVEKFLAIARTFEAGGFTTLSDFVAYLDVMIEEQEKEGEAPLEQGHNNAVQIMTVHAAKGLEFPLVVIPDLDAHFNLRQSDPVLIDRDLGLGINAPDPEQKYQPTPSALRRLIADQNRRKTIAEEKRLYYVALTRARDHLILSGRFESQDLGIHLQQGKSKLQWLLAALQINTDDIQAGFKPLDKQGQTLRILTDPASLPVTIPQPPTEPKGYQSVIDLLSPGAPDPGLPETPEILHQVTAQLDQLGDDPIFSVTQLDTYTRCPRRYFYRYLIGMPDWELFTGEGKTPQQEHQKQAAEFGELAHRLFEAFIADPAQGPEVLVKHLLLDNRVIDPVYQEERAAHLLSTLYRFKKSALWQILTSATETQTELPFLLQVPGGVISGQIDQLYHQDDRWKLIDYKTNRISPREKPQVAGQYRLQMSIYALCVRRFAPHQPDYQATIYFTELDQTERFVFSHLELDDLEAKMAETIANIGAGRFRCKPLLLFDTATPREIEQTCGSCAFFVNRICPMAAHLT